MRFCLKYPMRTRPLPSKSRAVLVGTATYSVLDSIPAVKNNILRLRDLLIDTDLFGLPSSHCTTLIDIDDIKSFPEVVGEAVQAAQEFLLIYYAGHGLVQGADDFCLAVPSSRKGPSFTAIRYEDIRREITRTRNHAPTAVILDCCYSARAFVGGMSAALTFNQYAHIDGACTLTACDETTRALAPPGDRHTAFTGELIKAIESGIRGEAEYLGLGALYRHLKIELGARALPNPQFMDRGLVSQIPLFKNRSFVSQAPFPQHIHVVKPLDPMADVPPSPIISVVREPHSPPRTPSASRPAPPVDPVGGFDPSAHEGPYMFRTGRSAARNRAPGPSKADRRSANYRQPKTSRPMAPANSETSPSKPRRSSRKVTVLASGGSIGALAFVSLFLVLNPPSLTNPIQPARTYEVSIDGISSVAMSGAPLVIASALDKQQRGVTAWSPSSRYQTTLIFPSKIRSYIGAAVFSSGGQYVAVSDLQGQVFVYEVSSHRLVAQWHDPSTISRVYICAMAFSGNHRVLALVGNDSGTYAWNLATDKTQLI